MKTTILSIALALIAGVAAAEGTKPVTTGKVIRGLTLPPPPGAPGTPTGTTCDYSNENTDPVDQNGTLTGSSVNCGPDGTLAQNLVGLPARFNAYCVIDAPVKSGRLIQASLPGDANHCDLSGIKPKDATGQFNGAVWR
jgi:hypothetical protein